MIIESENALFRSGPPWTWLHRLHQVTGLLARRGLRLTDEDRTEMLENLRWVLSQMEDDKIWDYLRGLRR
jgi:hypothetical protein